MGAAFFVFIKIVIGYKKKEVCRPMIPLGIEGGDPQIGTTWDGDKLPVSIN